MRNFTVFFLSFFLLACQPETDDSASAPELRSVLEEGAFAGANVLFLSLEAVRTDFVGVYNPEVYNPTTAIDRLLDEGVRLNQAVCSGSWTPPCMMSAISGSPATELATAAFKPVNDSGAGFLPSEETTLAEAMKASGYSTYLLSGNTNLGSKTGTDAGFDKAEEYDPGFAQSAGRTMEAANQVVNAISEMSAPWLAHLHIMEPHFTYDPPEEYLGCLEGLSALPEQIHLNNPDLLENLSYGWDEIPAEDLEIAITHLRCRYGGEVEWISEIFFEAMLGDLESGGFLDNTLVVIVSDHGEAFGEHELFHHGMSVYPEETRIVGGFWAKDIASGTIDDFLNLGDIAPAVLHALGIEKPVSFLGRSFDDLPDDRVLTQFSCDRKSGDETMEMYGAIDTITGLKIQLVEESRWEQIDLFEDPTATNKLTIGTEEVPDNLLSAIESLRTRADKEGWCEAL